MTHHLKTCAMYILYCSCKMYVQLYVCRILDQWEPSFFWFSIHCFYNGHRVLVLHIWTIATGTKRSYSIVWLKLQAQRGGGSEQSYTTTTILVTLTSLLLWTPPQRSPPQCDHHDNDHHHNDHHDNDHLDNGHNKTHSTTTSATTTVNQRLYTFRTTASKTIFIFKLFIAF